MVKYKNLATSLSWVIVLFWMLLIFNLSSQVAEQSKQLSNGVTEVVIETVEKVAPNKVAEIDIRRLNHLIRKNAHFFAYLILGILVLNAINKTVVNSTKGIIITFLICTLYAISDEVHQLFVPGRGGQIKDVLLDSAGAIVGIGLYLVASKLKKKT